MSTTAEFQREVDENLRFFEQELPNIPASQAGKYALLHKRRIAGYFDTPTDAVKTGNSLFKGEPFSIQQVTTVPIELGFYSHARDMGDSQ